MLGEVRADAPCNGLRREAVAPVNGDVHRKPAPVNGEARKLSAAERLGVAPRRPEHQAAATASPSASGPAADAAASCSSSSSTASNSSTPSPVPAAKSNNNNNNNNNTASSGSPTPTPSPCPARRPNSITGSPRRAIANGRPISAAELAALGDAAVQQLVHHGGPRGVVEALMASGRGRAETQRPTVTIKPQPLRRSSLIEDAQRCAAAAAAAASAAATAAAGTDYLWMDDPLNVARTTTADHVEHAARRRGSSLEHVRRRARPEAASSPGRPASVASISPDGWTSTSPSPSPHSFALYTPPAAPLAAPAAGYARYSSPGGLPPSRRSLAPGPVPRTLTSSTSVPAQLSSSAAVPPPQAAPRRPPTFQAPPPPAPPSPRRPASSDTGLTSSVSSPSLLRAAPGPRARPHSFPSAPEGAVDLLLEPGPGGARLGLGRELGAPPDSGYRSLPSDHLSALSACSSANVLRALYLCGMRPSPTFHGMSSLSAAAQHAARPRPASIAHLLTPMRPPPSLPPHKLALFYDILDAQERFTQVCRKFQNRGLLLKFLDSIFL
ncbi:Chromobox protein-like protein 6 [Frankliniella fusca]|uniref:Chromobox protein-like protein 6 n=1 Tax=Frankliniella fusca TaxID=407009 RepID=A0AAE1LPN9_9NEOP|nr:Chromobox protein-like protein 6 [Frankliniella fusca]